MIYNVDVEVSTRNGVLNPEAKAILGALQTHDFAVSNLSINRKFSFALESSSKDKAEEIAEAICQDFLANVILQDYTITIKEA